MRSSILLARADLVNRDGERAGATTTTPTAAPDAGGEDTAEESAAGDDTADGAARGESAPRSTCGRTSTRSRVYAPVRVDERRRPGHGRRPAPRQPDPLPGDGGRGRRCRPLRQGRVDDHGPTAAAGAAVGAAVPQLRRRVRAAGRRAEPDGRADRGRRRVADLQPHTHRRGGSPHHRAGERPGRGPIPGAHRRGRHGTVPGRGRERHVHRRDRGRAPGLHPGDRRGVRDLRRRRRGRDRAADAGTDRRVPPVRRARDQHVVDRAASR